MIPRGRSIATAPLIKWGVIRSSDDALIGTCTLLDIIREHRRATVGYALGRKRLGFQREGPLRARYHLNGEVQDSVIYGLPATEMETGS